MDKNKYIVVCSARQKHGVCHSKILGSFDVITDARNCVVKYIKAYTGVIDCEIIDYLKYEVFEDNARTYGVVYDILKIKL